jgi:glutathione peroxidase
MPFPRISSLIAGLTLAVASSGHAADAAPGFTFQSIDGGSYDTADWRGKPVLVVNTASMCGFTPQYNDLQALSDKYGDRAVVLAVPSDDFNQELSSDKEVKDYCDANFGLTLPMTSIEHVAKGQVHPFYAWVRDQNGFTPGWNFNKVLIGPDGQFVKAWGSATKPGSKAITGAIDALLN